MPRSNSSRGVAEGGRVVESRPAGLRRRPCCAGGSGAGAAPADKRPPVLARSSGSPASRPPGAPTGASAGIGSWPPPSARGAPGAFGFWLGIEGIATAARPGAPAARLLLHDRRGRSDLRLLVSSAARLAAAADWLLAIAGLRRWAGGTAATLGCAGGAVRARRPASARRRSSSWRLRYCSSSFWPVSCRSWFSSRSIRISGSPSSDCGEGRRCDSKRAARRTPRRR